MEASKICDLGPCVLKSQRSENALRVFPCDLEASLGARACIQVPCISKNAAFCVYIVKPTKIKGAQTMKCKL